MKFLLKLKYFFIIIFITYFSALNIKLKAVNNLPKFYLGNANAPVTVYEFISLSCLYCVDNINLFLPPDGQENSISNLIKSGKVKLVIMDFPIHGKVDYLAHSILYYSKNNDQYFKLLKLFLNNQDKWVRSNNPTEVIINYGKLGGLTDEAITKFKKDTKTTHILTDNANTYIAKYNIRATPTTIIEKSNKPITSSSFTEVGMISLSKLENAIKIYIKK